MNPAQLILSPNFSLDYPKLADSNKNAASFYRVVAIVSLIAVATFAIVGAVLASTLMQGAFIFAACLTPIAGCYLLIRGGFIDYRENGEFFTKVQHRVQQLQNNWTEADVEQFLEAHEIEAPQDEEILELLREKSPAPIKAFIPLIAHFQVLEETIAAPLEGYGYEQVVRCKDLIAASLILENLATPTKRYATLEARNIEHCSGTGEFKMDGGRCAYHFNPVLNREPLSVEMINRLNPDMLRTLIFIPDVEEEVLLPAGDQDFPILEHDDIALQPNSELPG